MSRAYAVQGLREVGTARCLAGKIVIRTYTKSYLNGNRTGDDRLPAEECIEITAYYPSVGGQNIGQKSNVVYNGPIADLMLDDHTFVKLAAKRLLMRSVLD